jgi:hypothetical protein
MDKTHKLESTDIMKEVIVGEEDDSSDEER